MDKKTNIKDWLHNPNIKCSSLSSVMENAYGRYAKYVIQDRALPDVRDGLKPVQRRILYAMNNLGLYSNRPYKKSARTVGEVIGKYHPHGDSSIYEAMVRMSQDWKNNSCLIDMQGNNGSIDGDGAAAMRYTECRLSSIAMQMLDNLDKDTVEWVFNFDDTEKEPTILPSLFPNLLVNGSTGIAAGYATNMPPHNPTEVLNALKFLLKYPNANLESVMKYIPGPDFPTGGIINGTTGIVDAYKTGKGKIELNCNYEIRGENKNFYDVVIKNVPFEVKKSDLVCEIAKIAFEEEIDGIENVVDESDANGVNIALQIKKDKNVENIMSYLFKKTSLSISYSFNNTVIANKKPVCLGLCDLLNEHLNHCFDMIVKAAIFDLNKANQKLEIILGLIKCISILDEIITLIRASISKSDAKEKLINRYRFTENQAEAILNMKLYRLTNTDVAELKKDKETLEQLIAELDNLINNKEKQIDKLIQVFDKYIQEFGYSRRTKINEEQVKYEIDSKGLISNEKWILGISNFGYLKLISPRSWNNEKSLNEYTFNNEKDSLIFLENVYTLDTVVMITKFGKLVCLPIHKLKTSKIKDKGNHLNDFVTLAGSDQIIGAFLLKHEEVYFDKNLAILTKNGMIKSTSFSELVTKQNLKATSIIKLDENDEIVSFDIIDTNKNYFVNIVANNGNALCFESSQIPVYGKNSSGVLAMKLKGNEVLKGMAIVDATNAKWIVMCEQNYEIIDQNDVVLGNRNSVGKQIFNKKLNFDKIISIKPIMDKSLFIVKENDKNTVIEIDKLKTNKLTNYDGDIKATNICEVKTTKTYLSNKKDTNIDLFSL